MYTESLNDEIRFKWSPEKGAMFIGRSMYTCASVAGTYDGHIGLKPHEPSLGLNVKVNPFYTPRLKTRMGEFLNRQLK